MILTIPQVARLAHLNLVIFCCLACKCVAVCTVYGQYALGELRYADAEANDDAEALALFQLAAEQNLDRAQLKLGKILYRNGLCPPEQHAEALRWFKLAAGQGDGDGLFMVGYMHELGHSVPAVTVPEPKLSMVRTRAPSLQRSTLHCIAAQSVVPLSHHP